MSEEGCQMTATNPHEDSAAGTSRVLPPALGHARRTTPRADDITLIYDPDTRTLRTDTKGSLAVSIG